MAFFRNIHSSLSQASQTAIQKVKNLSEIARLNRTISASEKQTASLYSQIGHTLYGAYRDDPQPEAADLFSQVRELQEIIDACNAKITAIHTADRCPQCGAKINRGMVYCGICGLKLPVPAPEPPVTETDPYCSQCGFEIPLDSLFCPNCGKKLT